MDNDNSRSSPEDSPEHSSTNETVQKMDSSEKCSKSEENTCVGLTDKKLKASFSGLSRTDDQLKSFARHTKGGTLDPISSENVRHSCQDSQLSTDKPDRIDEKTEKFERNLEKFFKEREPLKEVQLRKKTEISARLVKSDGEMAKILEYCCDALKISKNERSSAPPTFNSEMEAKQKNLTEEQFCDESSKKVISKEVAQTSDIFKKDAVGTESPSPTAVLDRRLSKISTFKVPISPDQKATPDKSARMVRTDSNEDAATPVQRRPTHFNVGPRKAFYTFSPDSPSGVLRQSQSLPDINRPRRKDETQRRSINFGEHSRIVRFLFKDEPEPATPESKVSTFYKTDSSGEKLECTENVREREVPKTLQNIPSKTCRRLDFGSVSKETADKKQKAVVKNVSCVEEAKKNTSHRNASQVEVQKTLQNHPSKSCKKLVFGSSAEKTTKKSQQLGVSCDAESPTKRKISSPVEPECFISTKKVKTSLGTKVEESGYVENVRDNAIPVDVECSVSAKKFGTSPGTKIEEGGRSENLKVVDVECSIPAENVRTSLESKMEGKGSFENIRKHASPADVESSISAKKVRTFSETKK